ALLVLSGPGLPPVLALRLRPLTACVALVPFSLLAIAISAEAGHLLGVPWSIASPLLLGLLLGAVLWLPGRRRATDAATTEDDGAESVGRTRPRRTAPRRPRPASCPRSEAARARS